MARSGADWSSEENDALVAAYLEILSRERRGESVVKREHIRALQPSLSDRSRGAIEYKMQNVSAVLQREGLPWINGFKPARNNQHALRDAVLRALSAVVATRKTHETPHVPAD